MITNKMPISIEDRNSLCKYIAYKYIYDDWIESYTVSDKPSLFDKIFFGDKYQYTIVTLNNTFNKPTILTIEKRITNKNNLIKYLEKENYHIIDKKIIDNELEELKRKYYIEELDCEFF